MTSEYLTGLLAAFFDNPRVQTYKLMTQGKENTTALVTTDAGKVIVRMWGETHGYMGTHSDDDILDEITFMDFCRKQGAPVPMLYRSHAGNLYEKTPDGRAYGVMEYVEGNSPQQFTPEMVEQIAMVMARLHLAVADFSFPAKRSWPGTVLDMTNTRIAAFEAGDFVMNQEDTALLQEAIRHYQKLLDSCNLAALPSAVIHGDIMWENIKFQGAQLAGIFDFGDCRESYFIEDITKSLLFAFESPNHCMYGETGENIGIFLRAYQRVRPLTNVEKQSLRLFFVSRFLYQTLGYCAKVSKGETEYQAQVNNVLARYKQHKPFFEAETYA